MIRPHESLPGVGTSNRALRAALRVRPGQLELTPAAARATPAAVGDKSVTKDAMAAHAGQLAAFQEALYAEGATGGTRRVLVVLQGMDTSGKGGVIKHVLTGVNPQGVHVVSFKKPTDEEMRHHFLWRVRPQLPGPGKIGIFDRSHYEDVLVPRVHGTVPAEVVEQRYAEINEFEDELTANGTTLLKCFLHLSYGEQRTRLLARLDDPTKHWKFNTADLDERARWDDYPEAYRQVLERCNPPSAPWHVVPADRKWYRNWAVSQLLLETLAELDPVYPPGNLDVAALRARLAPPH